MENKKIYEVTRTTIYYSEKKENEKGQFTENELKDFMSCILTYKASYKKMIFDYALGYEVIKTISFTDCYGNKSKYNLKRIY